MGSRLVLVALLVLAVLAGAAFWWSSEEGSRAPTDPLGRRAEEPRAETIAGGVEAPTDLARESSSAERRTVPETSLRADVDLGAARDSQEGVRLVGSVTTRDAQPIAGATVTATHANRFLRFEPGGDSGVRETKTDREGRFEVTGIEPGSVDLGVRAAGYAPVDRRDVAVPAGERVELDPILLTLGAILSGNVYDPAGDPVEGAELFRRDGVDPFGFFAGQDEKPVAVTGADGSFRIDQLALGEWNILVRTLEHPDRAFKGLAERAGEEIAGLRFVLEPGTTISGRVEGIPEKERGKLEIRASEASADWFQSRGTRRAEVDERGRFTVRGVALDTDYDLEVQMRAASRHLLWGESRAAEVRAHAGDSDVVIPYQLEAALLFQVVDAQTRMPIEEFTVEAGVDWSRELTDDQGKPLRTHPDGFARFGGLRPEGPNARVKLQVRATGYRDFVRENIALATGQELDLGQVFLEPVPVVRVTVRDARTGEPVSGALVTLEKEVAQVAGRMNVRMEAEVDDQGNVSIVSGDARARTDSGGVAVMTSLQGEVVTLRVESRDHAPYRLGGIVLPTGTGVERQVELTPGGVVVVRVVDPAGEPVAGAPISHRAPGSGGASYMTALHGGGGKREVTDSAGVVRFSKLASGMHRFKLSDGPGGSAMRMGDQMSLTMSGEEALDDSWAVVEVLEGGESEITLQAAARASLAGRVLEGGKVLTGATVRLEERGGRGGFRMPGPFGGDDGLSSRTDGRGEYLIQGVEEGAYALTVEHATRQMSSTFDLEVRPGENTFDVDLPISIVEGRITSTEKKPLPGIRVRAERHTEEPQPRQRFVFMFANDSGPSGGVIGSGDLGGDPAVTDEDGRYRLRGVLSDTELVVVASGREVQEKSTGPLTVGPGQTASGIDLTMLQAGSLLVEVLRPDGAPAGFQIVRATYQGEEETEPEIGFTGEDGTTTLEGLRPGSWLLNVSRPGPDDPGTDDGVEEQVEVRGGEEVYAPVHLD